MLMEQSEDIFNLFGRAKYSGDEDQQGKHGLRLN